MSDLNFPIEKRIRAAMELVGVDFPGLARLLGRKGMGTRMLRYWADPDSSKTPQPHELRYIAETCGLDPEFFTLDLAQLSGPATEDEVSQLRERIERLEQQVGVQRLSQLRDDLAALGQSPAAHPDTERPR